MTFAVLLHKCFVRLYVTGLQNLEGVRACCYFSAARRTNIATREKCSDMSTPKKMLGVDLTERGIWLLQRARQDYDNSIMVSRLSIFKNMACVTRFCYQRQLSGYETSSYFGRGGASRVCFGLMLKPYSPKISSTRPHVRLAAPYHCQTKSSLPVATLEHSEKQQL